MNPLNKHSNFTKHLKFVLKYTVLTCSIVILIIILIIRNQINDQQIITNNLINQTIFDLNNFNLSIVENEVDW